MYFRDLPEKCRLVARARVDNNALDNASVDLRRMTEERLRQQIAALLVHEKAEERRREYHTDFTMELFVLTPDELAKMIREEASRLTTFMRPPMRLKP